MLNNLVVNALKYGRPGTPVRIRLDEAGARPGAPRRRPTRARASPPTISRASPSASTGSIPAAAAGRRHRPRPRHRQAYRPPPPRPARDQQRELGEGTTVSVVASPGQLATGARVMKLSSKRHRPLASGTRPGSGPAYGSAMEAALKRSISRCVAAGLALAGCGQSPTGGGAGDGGARQEIRIVGSSTVYPFTKAVAEQFAQGNSRVPRADRRIDRHRRRHASCSAAASAPSIPDIANASRRIKASELAAMPTPTASPRSSRSRSASTASRLIESAHAADRLHADRARHLCGARRQSVRPAADRADLARRQSGAARRADPGLRPAADLGHARQLRRADPDKGCESDPAMKALKESDSDRHKDGLHPDPRGRRLSSRPARTTIC